MYSEPQNTLFVRIVDFLWDHKIRFLFVVAALFFAINGVATAVQSFNRDTREVTESVLPSVEATTTEVFVDSQPQPTSTTTVVAQKSAVQTTTQKPAAKPVATTQTKSPIVQQHLPNRIVIARIGVDIAVANPISTNINVLNDQLTRTVVRYQGSGTMTEGNILIMGHSSELPVIRNPLYKVFSQLKYLVAGDEIKVYSDTSVNTYRVRSVKMLSANSDEAYIPFTTGTNMLTLVTCNVRGAKDERYIVESDLIAGN